MAEIIQMIASDLLLPTESVRRTVALARNRTRQFTIPKRSGGARTIVQPALTLKPVLSWLNNSLIGHLPVNEIATAFRSGKSILDNATAHSDSTYSVRIDISDFYHSIKSSDLVQAIWAAKSLLPPWACEPDSLALIENVCFDQAGRLPIGYSTSPGIANAVMYKMDCHLAALISNEKDFGAAVVTRYADDFIFSTDKPGACNKFLAAFEKTLVATKSPTLSINAAKTRFMSRPGGSTLVTGLRINNLGGVVVHANYRDHVRLLLKLYKEKRLMADDVPKLVGHLAHIQHVDPALFTKLSFKFYEDIARIRGKLHEA
jgi:RNA-directed DNA polymerase